jgi:hypothetical protein
MADQLYKGFYQALEQGLLEGAPDIRVRLFMSGFTADEDCVNVSDAADLDEFDGVGYAEIDAANVVAGYVDGSDEWQLDFDDDLFGDPVAPGSDDIEGMYVVLNVDGDPDNDILLGSTTTGGFGVNASNGALNLTLPASGLMFVRQA